MSGRGRRRNPWPQHVPTISQGGPVPRGSFFIITLSTHRFEMKSPGGNDERGSSPCDAFTRVRRGRSTREYSANGSSLVSYARPAAPALGGRGEGCPLRRNNGSLMIYLERAQSMPAFPSVSSAFAYKEREGHLVRGILQHPPLHTHPPPNSQWLSQVLSNLSTPTPSTPSRTTTPLSVTRLPQSHPNIHSQSHRPLPNTPRALLLTRRPRCSHHPPPTPSIPRGPGDPSLWQTLSSHLTV